MLILQEFSARFLLGAVKTKICLESANSVFQRSLPEKNNDGLDWSRPMGDWKIGKYISILQGVFFKPLKPKSKIVKQESMQQGSPWVNKLV